MSLYAIVLAAGEGTRMRSQRPKPLHLICGRPMVMHVIHSLSGVHPDQSIIVVGHGADQVTTRVTADSPVWANVSFASQSIQRGTGDAVSVGLTALDQNVRSGSPAEHDDTSTILVLPGDTPLLRRETIDSLVQRHESSGQAATVLVAQIDDPTGYGRVVRAKDGRVLRIVEQRDATDDERKINEINTSIYAFRRDLLGPALRRVTPNNAQSEYYLTDVVAVLADMGHQVGAVVADASETQGVNDRWQLALAERELRSRTNRYWLLNGVTMFDPRQTFIDVDVQIERGILAHIAVPELKTATLMVDALGAQKLALGDPNVARELAALYLSTGKSDLSLKQAKALQASSPKSASATSHSTAPRARSPAARPSA